MFELTADDGDAPVSNRSVFARKLKIVRNALGANSSHTDFDVNHLLEFDRLPIITTRVDSRKADLLPIDRADNTKPDAPQQRVLGLLHVGKEIGKVHDARHVGITEFDATGVFECLGHAGSFAVFIAERRL